ncbi:putative cytosolic protein [Granulibacter bethesdensis]|uniref:Cytosolic protein n=2 Tax=Granulibacter bethesdensis TaxID=364410 RepID=Q0BUK6_GRABC|nr:putative cytosolic protein [Granulibacter bethesdensis CGDNIH1]AHJ67627.1 putative cytosolic protein [Granulibacter bethesdensis]APH51291.1 putative cytosolic protein [Granulibacter bethesdensis]APH63985.1 putative cytosolic protein [Granulibacter bethesdensis]
MQAVAGLQRGMIHYSVRCRHGHSFDGWFASSGAFDRQVEAGLIECPVCGDTQVERGLMTPSLGRKGNTLSEHAPVALPPDSASDDPLQAVSVPTPATASAAGVPAQLRAALQALRAQVEKHCDPVGEKFAAEALRIHRGEAEARGIYGQATAEEAEMLQDEGVSFAAIPWVPRSDS